ncbi:MAG: amidophosphoribosyltransferase [Candidatus Pacebacteria bacterium]|nr:amidophosphoribosyltransferase [Candidatus Paceibacterota bacterium]MCF7863058.1 amidophosphoribosyltransferase [Candidatus Paceibacterota bacterium]
MNELKEKCGVVGIFTEKTEVAKYAFFSLFALQHRGQEASGITSTNGIDFHTHKGAGLVSSVYNEESILKLKGNICIGHNRYSTSQGGALSHAQPVVNLKENFALAHNGNLPSVKALEKFLKEKGVLQQDRSDSELIADAIGFYLDTGLNIEKAVQEVFPLLTGSFSLVMMSKDSLVAVRDKYGMRPLCLGKLLDGYIIASESCALKTIGASFVREINEGEMIILNKEGLKSVKLAEKNPKHDVFEYVYFSRPDSVLAGKLVYQVRKNLGINLAKENKLDVDFIIPVPDTAVPVALGFTQESGIPMELGLIKNRYVHRTFIEPDQDSRRKSVALKLIPMNEVLKDKKIAVIDDSIVRGHTSKRLVQTLFEAGAKEVHLLISSPPVRFPDFYGIDTPKQEELLGSSNTVEQMREFIGATSLNFLSLEGLVDAVGLPKEELCTSFFTGEYPIDILERKNEVNYDVPKS